MSLPAFTNKPGLVTRTQPMDFHQVSKSTGIDTLSQKNVFVGRSNRSSVTKSGIHTIAGVKFKPPTTYRRYVSRWTAESPGAWETINDYLSGYWGFSSTDADNAAIYPFTLDAKAEWVSNDQNRARTECLDKLNEASVSLGEDLAQLHLTVRTTVNTFSRMAKAFVAVRRKDFRLAATELGLTSTKGMAENFLEYQFGWKPLAQDIYHGVQLIKAHQGPLVMKAVREVKNTWSGSKLKGNPPGSFTKNVTFDGNTRNKCVLWGVIDDNFVANAKTIGVHDPLELAWELIPYSFVIDWILPVGNFLLALSGTAGLTFLGGYESYVASGKYRLERGAWDYTRKTASEWHTGEVFDFYRMAFSDWPLPRPYVKDPFHSYIHVADALALLRSLKA